MEQAEKELREEVYHNQQQKSSIKNPRKPRKNKSIRRLRNENRGR